MSGLDGGVVYVILAETGRTATECYYGFSRDRETAERIAATVPGGATVAETTREGTRRIERQIAVERDYLETLRTGLPENERTSMSGLEPVIAVYATRYAIGRHSGAQKDVRAFIHQHLDVIRADHGCRQAILRDLSEAEQINSEWKTVVDLLLAGEDRP